MFTKTKNVLIAVISILTVLMANIVMAAEPEDGVQILKFDRPENSEVLPANFRRADSFYIAKRVAKRGVTPSRAGLDGLRQSGSSYFAVNEFDEMMKLLPKDKVVVLDLRNESHGYINGNGVSWYSKYKTFNKGCSSSEVMAREEALLQAVLQAGTVNVADLGKAKEIVKETPVKVNSVMTEKQLVESKGVKYYRIPIMDYSAPTPANIDQLIEFYKALPQDAWVHTHCEAGVGRTTMTLTFLDMIANASSLSYDEIMTREYMLGGQDVRESASTTKDAYKKLNYPKRAEMTLHFYTYAKAHPQLDIKYSEFCKQKGWEY